MPQKTSAPSAEIPPAAERAELIQRVVKEAAAFLCVDSEHDTPAHIVKVVDEVIVRLVFGENTALSDQEERHLLLGSLWGQQMVREFGWQWADIRFEGALDVAVVSPKRDMAIYPFTFVAGCLGRRHVCTVELSFNMLRERKRDVVFQSYSYEDIMQHIRHIVPPYVLESDS